MYSVHVFNVASLQWTGYDNGGAQSVTCPFTLQM